MKRHRTDPTSFIFGLLFVGIAAWWLVGRYVEVNMPNLDWAAALALILLGLIGIMASLRRDRDRDGRNMATTPEVVSTEAPPSSTNAHQSDSTNSGY